MTDNLNTIISKDIADRLKEIFISIATKYHITLIEWHHKDDSIIKTIFTAHPNTELSKFINAYKSAASRLVKKEFPYLSEKLCNGQFWNKTFCLLTVDHGVEFKEIEKYIDKQR